MLTDYTFDVTEVEDFLNDPRLLALAKIKFMNQEDRDLDADKKQQELKEMVAYVLNAKAQDEMVERITERLAKKVYSDDFNVFVKDNKAAAIAKGEVETIGLDCTKLTS